MSEIATPRWWTVMALVSVLIGPLLLALRQDVASALEKFIYVTLIFPLGLILFPIRHAVLRKAVLREPDPQLRQARLDELKRKFRQLMFVLIPASLIGITVSTWLLFFRLL